MRYFVFTVIFCFTLLSAQEVAFQEYLIDDGFDGPAGIFWADLNGDGRKDIISTALDSGEVAWWENETGITENWPKHYIGTISDAIYVFVEDINNDTFNDVIVAAWDSNTICWWENADGSGINWEYHEVDSVFPGAHEVFAADVNSDGFMDILGAAAVGNEIAWWENLDGSGENWDKHIIDADYNGARSVDVANLVEGGYLEVIGAALLDNDVSWWKYDEINDIWEKNEIIGNFDNSHKVVVCYINDDDDPDILGTAYSDGIYWFENNGDNPPTFTTHDIAPGFGGAVIAYPGDFNDDGNMDVAGSSQGLSKVAWWENTGGASFDWIYHEISPFFNNAWPLNTGDIDNDGDWDVVAGGREANEIRWWDNLNLSAQFTAYQLVGHAPLQVDFEDQSLGEVDSWNWDFQNDGIIDSNEQNVSFTYTEPGIYSVSLEVISGEDTSIVVKEGLISVFNGFSALEFDGSESNVYMPAYIVPEISEAFTIEAWVYPYSFGSDPNFGLARIFDKYSLSIFLSNQFPLYMDHSLVVQMVHSDGTTSTSTTSENSISLDQWQHIAVSYDGISEVKMFIDSLQLMSHQPVNPIGDLSSNEASDIIIGNVAENTKGFDGMIDDVRVWNVSKDQSEIQENMNLQLMGTEENLVHYWRFSEGSGDYVFDETDLAMGIINGAAWVQGIELNPLSSDKNTISINEINISNYPNPFNPATTIYFELPISNEIPRLDIYNLKGQKVKSLFNDFFSDQPVSKVVWNGTDQNNQFVASGIYFIQLEVGSIMATHKILLMK